MSLVQLSWLLNLDSEGVVKYRIQGQNDWSLDTIYFLTCILPPYICGIVGDNIEQKGDFILLSNLVPCSSYEVQSFITAFSSNQDVTSDVFTISTHCEIAPCNTPYNLRLDTISSNSVTISWEDFDYPEYEDAYIVYYREKGDVDWIPEFIFWCKL